MNWSQAQPEQQKVRMALLNRIASFRGTAAELAKEIDDLYKLADPFYWADLIMFYHRGNFSEARDIYSKLYYKGPSEKVAIKRDSPDGVPSYSLSLILNTNP